MIVSNDCYCTLLFIQNISPFLIVYNPTDNSEGLDLHNSSDDNDTDLPSVFLKEVSAIESKRNDWMAWAERFSIYLC